MSVLIKKHTFKSTYFQGLVYCDYCEKLLWSLAGQGVQCTECNYSCHERCSDMVVQCRPLRRLSPDTPSVTDSEADSLSKYSLSPRNSFDGQRGSLSLHTATDDITPRHVLKRSAVDLESVYSQEASLEHPPRSSTSGAGSIYGDPPTSRSQLSLKTHSYSTKAYQRALKQHLRAIVYQGDSREEGSLHPHLLAKTLMRMIARSGAFFSMCRKVRAVYAWDRPVYSSVWCIVFVVCCYEPVLFALVPLLLVESIEGNSNSHNDTTTLANIMLPRYDESSPEYHTNLESLQHAMMLCIKVYDNLIYHLEHITMKKTTFKTLLLIGHFICLVLYCYGRWIVVCLGLTILLYKTWVGNAMESTGGFLLQSLQTVVDQVHSLTLQLALQKNPTRHCVLEISVYENQRWWTRHGFTSKLLRSERSAWSNITGHEPLPPKQDMPPPAHYAWGKEEWSVDKAGPWRDDVLSIMTLADTDEHGWVYTDHHWQNPCNHQEILPEKGEQTNKDSLLTLTRRRRWVRRAYVLKDTT